jgi:hypothetical protein
LKSSASLSKIFQSKPEEEYVHIVVALASPPPGQFCLHLPLVSR